MGHKRKMFTTGVVPIGGPRLKSRREARKVTSRFHQLQNEIGEIINTTTTTDHGADAAPAAVELNTQKQKHIERLEQSMEDMGGRDRYQQASVVTTMHHSTSKWVVSVLNKLGVYPHGKAMSRLRTLEVGAINTQLQKYPGLTVRAIDINSQHTLIEETDFFDITPVAAQDVVVCSMVVNCVDTPVRRGEMLVRLSAQLKVNSGLLFLVLPTKCINNEYLSHKQFLQYLRAINLVLPTSQEQCFDGIFPNVTTTTPLESFCSRVTPKLSFFVLMHQPLGVTTPLALTHTCVPTASSEPESTWITAENRFIHILKTIKIADHAGLLNHFKASEQQKTDRTMKKKTKKKKVSSVGRFNSSEFSLDIPPDILEAALSCVQIKSKTQNKKNQTMDRKNKEN